MEGSSNQPAGRAHDGDVWLFVLARYVWSHRGIGRSIAGATVLLTWDAVLSGSFLLSLIVCPIWFLFNVVKSAIQRPGWRAGLLNIAIPALTLGMALANDSLQYRVGKTNAPRIIKACEEFHAAKGTFPKTLDELVPRYLTSVPRAKYCLMYGEFDYYHLDNHPILVWCVVPPYGRKIYSFQDRRWGYID
jgi:hypothetical protein